MPATDAFTAAHHVRAVCPDLVVVEATAQNPDPLLLLAELRDYAMLRVLLVRADDHQAALYDKSQVSLAEFSDLMTLMLASHETPC